MNNKYARIKDRGLYDELQAYSAELDAAAHRRRKSRGRMIAIIAAAFAVFIGYASYTKLFPPSAIIDRTELTMHPAAALLDAMEAASKLATPGQFYIVKVTIEPIH